MPVSCQVSFDSCCQVEVVTSGYGHVQDWDQEWNQDWMNLLEKKFAIKLGDRLALRLGQKLSLKQGKRNFPNH